MYVLDTSSSHQISLLFERKLYIASEGAKAMQLHSSLPRHLFRLEVHYFTLLNLNFFIYKGNVISTPKVCCQN